MLSSLHQSKQWSEVQMFPLLRYHDRFIRWWLQLDPVPAGFGRILARTSKYVTEQTLRTSK